MKRSFISLLAHQLSDWKIGFNRIANNEFIFSAVHDTFFQKHK